MSKRSDYERKTTEYIMPILDELGFGLYDVEYLKEGSDYVLRVYIDKPGGININDCVDVSRRMNEILDREDYISDTYTFEVSSPGIERKLRKKEHFEAAVGKMIQVGLYAPMNGSKELSGELIKFSDNLLSVDIEGSLTDIPMDQVAKAKILYVEDQG